MSQNQISGTIPDFLSNLTHLTTLFLSENQLIATIPDSIGSLSKLTTLTLFNNTLGGIVPSSLCNIATNSTDILIFPSYGIFTCPFPSCCLDGLCGTPLPPCTTLSFSELQALQDLQAEWGAVLGWFDSPGDACVTPSWPYLDCSADGHVISLSVNALALSGTIPYSIGGLIYLNSLSLTSVQIGGTIPDSVGNLLSLASFDLFNNQLNGSVPDFIGDLSNLTTLTLSDNFFSGLIPFAVCSIANQSRDIFPNFGVFSCPLPECCLDGLCGTSLALCSNLDSSEIQALQDLQSEWGPTLNWTGSPVYACFNSWSYLTCSSDGHVIDLSIYNVSLSGTIPDSIDGLVYLNTLLLSDTQIAGTIPDSIGDLGNLADLDLSFNQLNGSIPDSIGNLTNLHFLYGSYHSHLSFHCF